MEMINDFSLQGNKTSTNMLLFSSLFDLDLPKDGAVDQQQWHRWTVNAYLDICMFFYLTVYVTLFDIFLTYFSLYSRTLVSAGKDLKDDFLKALAEREEANRRGKMTVSTFSI